MRIQGVHTTAKISVIERNGCVSIENPLLRDYSLKRGFKNGALIDTLSNLSIILPHNLLNKTRL